MVEWVEELAHIVRFIITVLSLISFLTIGTQWTSSKHMRIKKFFKRLKNYTAVVVVVEAGA